VEVVELGVIMVRLDAEVVGEMGVQAWPGGGTPAVPCHGRAGVVEEVKAAALGQHGGF
jgi:hypothetical protein